MRTILFSTILLAAAGNLSVLASPDDDTPRLAAKKSAAAISDKDGKLIKQVLSGQMAAQLRALTRPRLAGPIGDDNLQTLKKIAQDTHTEARTMVAKGDTKVSYDVIVQIGHFPRIRGKTGGEGDYVTEQEMAALVGVGIIKNLAIRTVGGKKIAALLIGADDFATGLKSRIFIALHTDASDVKCRTKPSVGFQKVSDASGMHGIALALALTLDIDAESFMRDNYTNDEAQYYAFSKMNTSDFKGLLEMSELTCPEQEKKLLLRADELSKKLAIAIQFALARRF